MLSASLRPGYGRLRNSNDVSASRGCVGGATFDALVTSSNPVVVATINLLMTSSGSMVTAAFDTVSDVIESWWTGARPFAVWYG